MSQLRSVGAQGDLDLPRITVIGNQSAGKSSVVEAISGIKVPRDAGTCTRCPMECRLSYSRSFWSCRISIRQEYDRQGRPLPLPNVTEPQFGNVITDKNDVELALRRAQFAVLNPSISHQQILEMSPGKLKEGVPGSRPLKFSRNSICVDLEGPDLTDLMFLDLPGIIQNAEPEVVQLVEDMVVSHIRGNCLILVALPMTDDIENQKAMRLAHQQDPEGRRTIGVLTKPDVLSERSNARNQWLDVLEGRKHVLQHGYYCTRQPDDDERNRNITTAEARAAESQFFRSTTPWSASTHANRLGTDNLVSTLSTLLVQIINERLPVIRQMANELMQACRHDLASLPEKVLAEPATHMLNLVTAFVTDIRQHVDGQSGMSGLIHERNAAFAEFKVAINNTQPKFVACVSGQLGTSGSPITIDGDLTATQLIASQRSVYLPDIRAHIAESITRELPGNIPFSAKKSLIVAFQETWLKSAVDCFESVKQSMHALLMRSIEEKFGRYDQLTQRLKESIAILIGKYYESCGAFLMAMLQVEQMPFTQNDHYLQSSTEKWLSRYKEERAGKRGRSSSDEGPSSKQRKLSGSLKASGGQQSALSSTSAAPFKFEFDAKNTNASSFTSATTTLPSSPALKPQESSATVTRGASPATSTDGNKVTSALALLADLGYTGLTLEDLGKLRPVDEYETEIAVMAEVRGYFQCAYKRVIDNIPALIDFKFLQAIAVDLQAALILEFQLGSEKANAQCAALLAEDPKTVAKREELLANRKRLEAVQMRLHNFGINRGAGQTM
ncbi:P-loop containing nucleoside triphosphate hydrolase protein [Mycena pura]|uniref:P-loop containing nucleoside triphosphate hydrolase protein n=1 Tax=Mycena pura TaxID=153505 RepID=A0AAD6UW73_9AGAR|nr:P-loop containing nucleoside triphosphate hydrolase protein [Mycena pura]